MNPTSPSKIDPAALATVEQVRAYLSAQRELDLAAAAIGCQAATRVRVDSYCAGRVASDFIIAVIDAIRGEGRYPYNRHVHEQAMRELGLSNDEFPHEGDGAQGKGSRALSWLVYFSQEEHRRRAQQLHRLNGGYTLMTQAMVDEACASRCRIELETGEFVSPRLHCGVVKAFVLRSRTRYVPVGSIHGKLVHPQNKAVTSEPEHLTLSCG